MLFTTKNVLGALIVIVTIVDSGLDWDQFRGLAISGSKGPMDPHGKVTTHFRRGVWDDDPMEFF